MKWFLGLLATVSALFNGDVVDKPVPVPINTAVIAFSGTYYAPVVAEPGNFPWAKKITPVAQKVIAPIAPVATITPVTPFIPSAPPILPPEDPYLVKSEPIGTTWLKMDVTYAGNGEDAKELPIFDVDREYWRADVWAYWISPNPVTKTPPENGYFKIEVYKKGDGIPIFTATSGTEESFHIVQIFKKPGKYYYKVFSKLGYSKYEINTHVSSKLAQ